jgi:hypothetical protein
MRKVLLSLIITMLLIAACSEAATPTFEPTETAVPTPTGTPTPAPPTATSTVEPTATPLPIQINFTPSEDNPILEKGSTGEWDNKKVNLGYVVEKDGLYHMFFSGSQMEAEPGPPAFGYATSSDGLSFAKHDANPILVVDDTGLGAGGEIDSWPNMPIAVPFVDGDTWTLYYNGVSNIGRTTAPSPSGPWSPGELVLESGKEGEWDAGLVRPIGVFSTTKGYVLYYIGGIKDLFYHGPYSNFPSNAWWMIGLATSPDGITWTKYDDPDTTDRPYAESDPVLQAGPSSWEKHDIWSATVLETESGWEMFYSGGYLGSYEGGSLPMPKVRIGYATSPDGIHWTKYGGNPIFDADSDPHFPYPIVLVTSALVGEDGYLVYYDYAWVSDMGAARGTITRELGE